MDVMKLMKLVNLINDNNNIKNHKSTIILIILLTICINISFQTPIEYRRYCGEEIPEIIKVVCKGQYNGYSEDLPTQPSIFRRRVRDGTTHHGNNNNNNSNSNYYYFTNRHYSNYNRYQSDDDIQVTQQHSKMKIVDECCHKPCGWRTLRTYCDIRSNGDGDLKNEPIPDNPLASITSTYHYPDVSQPIIKYQNDSTPNSNAMQVTSPTSSLSTNFDKNDKVRKNKKKKKHVKGRERPCRCRKRKRRGHSHHQGSSSTVFCVPCKKICRNVNKSPMRCQKV